MEQAISDLGERISELLNRHVPRPAGSGLGLTCAPKQLQTRTSPADGTVTERWSFDALDTALARVYPADQQRYDGNKTVLFKVTLNADGEPRFNNFVTSYFPALRAPWREMIAAEASLKSTDSLPMHLQTPNRWHHLEELMGHFAAGLDGELAQHGLAATAENRARLISVRLALGGGLIRGRQPEEALSADIAQWLAADIDLQVLIYAFDQSSSRWWRRGSNSEPLVPFEDALELKGIPLARIRALYPPPEPPQLWN